MARTIRGRMLRAETPLTIEQLRDHVTRELRAQARRLDRMADELEITGSPAYEVAIDAIDEGRRLGNTLNALRDAAKLEDRA